MLNVNQITAQLAKLPDQSLQRYAMMHKDDPYVVSLALAESNRRKELRTGAQMNPPQQPKVAEQAIQGMAAPLPEHVGIGQLPAGEMNFAGGGIVAFADGGDVPRYQSQGFVQLPGAQMSGLPIYSQGAFGPQAGSYDDQPWAQRKLDELVQKVQAGKASPQEKAWVNLFGADAAKRVASREQQALYQSAPDQTQAEAQRLLSMPSVNPTTSAPNAVAQTPPVSTGEPQLRAPSAGAPAGQGFDGSISGLQKLYSGLTGGPLVDPFAKEREELGQARLQGAAKRVEDFDADIAALGKAYEGTEARLNERKAKLEGSEKQNLGLALLQAGSAMMAGKSKYALANIGAGIGVGTEQFAKGLEKIDAAKERLDDAFDRVDQARRSEQMLTASERRRLQGDVYNAFVESKKDTISGMSDALGLKHKQAAAVFDGGIKLRIAQMDQEGRAAYAERAGNLGLFRALGEGDVKKGFDIYTSSQTESKGLAGLVQSFAKNPTALAILKQSDPELANLIQMQMRSMALQPTATPTGPVRP